MKDGTAKPEEDAPSTKAKNNIARISNLLVKSTIFDETLRFKGVSIGIDFLVTSHAPVNAIAVKTLAYLEDTRESTINSGLRWIPQE